MHGSALFVVCVVGCGAVVSALFSGGGGGGGRGDGLAQALLMSQMMNPGPRRPNPNLGAQMALFIAQDPTEQAMRNMALAQGMGMEVLMAGQSGDTLERLALGSAIRRGIQAARMLRARRAGLGAHGAARRGLGARGGARGANNAAAPL